MDLVVDIGNTRSKFACFEGNQIIKQVIEAANIQDLPSAIRNLSLESAIISASGNIQPQFIDKISQYASEVIIMDSQTPIPIALQSTTPETVGLDRKAACVGASVLFPQKNCLVFDAGTALTIDLLSAENGMIGGNISPGLNLRFQSLHTFTERLPLLHPKETSTLFGKSTQDSILSGVQQGILFEVQAYINRAVKEFPEICLVFTGGDAQFFVKNLKSSIFAEPDLVVIGLNRILKYYAEKK